MALHSRIKRINEELRAIIAEIIQNEIKDPRLAEVMITVTAVNTAKDLSTAQVYVSVLGDDEQTASAMKAMDHSKSFIRHEAASRTTFRHMPDISFKLDETGRNADRINSLLRNIEKQNPGAFEEPATEETADEPGEPSKQGEHEPKR